MSLIQAKKIVSVFIFSSLVLAGAIVAPLKPVQALGPGRVCMFNAPSGAGFVMGSIHGNEGHVGWAYEVGNSGGWVFGATEVADGKPSSTWIKNGDWKAVKNTFKSGADFHGIGYYTQYRCMDTPGRSVGAANMEAQHEQTDGYNLLDNNCLTKSVLIFRAYGVPYAGDGANPPYLVYAGYTGPNFYFDNYLTLAGFESASQL